MGYLIISTHKVGGLHGHGNTTVGKQEVLLVKHKELTTHLQHLLTSPSTLCLCGLTFF